MGPAAIKIQRSRDGDRTERTGVPAQDQLMKETPLRHDYWVGGNRVWGSEMGAGREGQEASIRHQLKSGTSVEKPPNAQET